MKIKYQAPLPEEEIVDVNCIVLYKPANSYVWIAAITQPPYHETDKILIDSDENLIELLDKIKNFFRINQVLDINPKTQS